MLQTLAATGVGEAELRAMVQMKGAPTMQTYLDVDGHLPRVATTSTTAQAALAGARLLLPLHLTIDHCPN